MIFKSLASGDCRIWPNSVSMGPRGGLQLGLPAVEQHVGVELADARCGIEVQTGVSQREIDQPLVDRGRQSPTARQAFELLVQLVGRLLVVGQAFSVQLGLFLEGGQLLFRAEQLVLGVMRVSLEILDLGQLRAVLLDEHAVFASRRS